MFFAYEDNCFSQSVSVILSYIKKKKKRPLKGLRSIIVCWGTD